MSGDNEDISNLKIFEKEKQKKPISARNKDFINQVLVSRHQRQQKSFLKYEGSGMELNTQREPISSAVEKSPMKQS